MFTIKNFFYYVLTFCTPFSARHRKPLISKFQKPLENEEKVECIGDGEANSFIYHDEHTNNVAIEHARDFFIINF